ncbi:flagellar hook-associated protein FlgK [Planomicrobium sp. CPCC 101110]|uniref:flagellar hook-associated protein FlgK n=1 Tax=Planomicrobium sp. CPCC 101110 TaxID=2599619 RepID=UPI0011B4EA0F|nr:flagellar hook-associated protein FlgK [Planomicrobium sp. CPCC 101110]TWT27818.1 flagellar hook-associated protein FlgK [Planomicrobium sp. CPCC 101110]
MVSTFHGLELGKRGLAVTQTSITTTGQNIANANTKGYSRQQVNASASPSLDVWTSGGKSGQLGTGVSLDSITRVRDSFLDRQFQDQSSALGESQVKQQTLDRLETIINEPSETGLSSSMDQLWAAWQDVANEPKSSAAQTVLKERATEFVNTAQAMDRDMTYAIDDLNRQQADTVNQVNEISKQIAELNGSIKKAGNHANDLMDKRDALVEELSTLATIKVTANTDGTNSISLRNADGTAGTSLVKSDVKSGAIIDGTEVSGGKLAGIIQSKETVAHYQTELASTIEQFVTANGLAEASAPGANLFTKDKAAFKVSELNVNPTISKDNPAQNANGDIQKVKTFFQSLVSELGAQSQSAIRTVENNGAALLATDNRRMSVTGVSIDEEMANLIMYQHSYSAAARFVSTTDQMLDVIINQMGR